MTAERTHYNQTQQFFPGQGTEIYKDEDRLLHHTNNAQRLGALALTGVDPFVAPHKSYRIHLSAAALEAEGQEIVQNAISSRTIELGSSTQDSIFFFNPDENAEKPELA